MLSNGDLASVSGLSSAVLASLLTDARATAEQVATPQLRGGWIGSALDPDDFELGSLLWVLEPAKLTQNTVATAASLAREALEWLIDEGIAQEVEVTGEIRGAREAGLNVLIRAPDGTIESQYIDLWRQTTFRQSTLPALLVDPVEFSPEVVPGLATFYSAPLSNHTIDQFCGVTTAQDRAGTVNLIQSTEASRPRRVLTSGGWHYQFFSGRHLASPEIPLPSIRQGTLFTIIKPRPGALSDGRMVTFGFTGFGDATRGLALRQGANGEVRLFGDAGALDVTLTSTGDSIGVVARWGLKADGARLELSDDLAANGAAYNNDFAAPNRLVIGAGYNGTAPDPTVSPEVDIREVATYTRRITDQEALQFLDYAERNAIVFGEGEPFGDCSYFRDDTGFS